MTTTTKTSYYNTDQYRILNALRKGPQTIAGLTGVCIRSKAKNSDSAIFNKILNLRKKGHDIRSTTRGGVTVYTLLGDAGAHNPRSYKVTRQNSPVRVVRPPKPRQEQPEAPEKPVTLQATSDSFTETEFGQIRQVLDRLVKYAEGDDQAVRPFRTNDTVKNHVRRLEWRALGLAMGWFDEGDSK